MGKPSPVTNVLMPLVVYPLLSLISIFRPAYSRNIPARAGEALAELALGEVTLPTGRITLPL